MNRKQLEDMGLSKEQVDSIMKIEHQGDRFKITLMNPVSYAPYYEYGHRTKKGGWVNGQRTMTISEEQIRNVAPKLVEARLEEFLKEAFR